MDPISVLQHVETFSRFFGLFPYSVDRNFQNDARRHERISFISIWTFTLAVVSFTTSADMNFSTSWNRDSHVSLAQKVQLLTLVHLGYSVDLWIRISILYNCKFIVRMVNVIKIVRRRHWNLWLDCRSINAVKASRTFMYLLHVVCICHVVNSATGIWENWDVFTSSAGRLKVIPQLGWLIYPAQILIEVSFTSSIFFVCAFQTVVTLNLLILYARLVSCLRDGILLNPLSSENRKICHSVAALRSCLCDLDSLGTGQLFPMFLVSSVLCINFFHLAIFSEASCWTKLAALLHVVPALGLFLLPIFCGSFVEAEVYMTFHYQNKNESQRADHTLL